MADIEVNSRQYWDKRFRSDWDAKMGRQQSRYFAQLAIEHLPSWLAQEIREQKLTICDWGCAEGDGTDILAGQFGRELVTGVDFSSEAIERAQAEYPHLTFSVEDWIENDSPEGVYDIVFSSNTLEHFREPHVPLLHLMSAARKCVALLLPYRELDRHHEHFYTFLASNIAFAPSRDYVLAHSVVIDSKARRPVHWPGLQVLLLYTRPEFAAQTNLSLSDIELGDEKLLESRERTLQLERMVEEGERSKVAQLRRIDEQEAELAHHRQSIVLLERALAAQARTCSNQVEQLNAVLNSTSWRVTAPLRALSLTSGAFRASYALPMAKSIYRKLPVSIRRRLYPFSLRVRSISWMSEAPLSGTSRKWIDFLRGEKKIAIIPCGFEFDELVNQRPINAAKYLASQGFKVLFVAWQWGRGERLEKSNTEVWEGVFQVSLYDFVDNVSFFPEGMETGYFVVTMPAAVFTEATLVLRSKGASIIYDIMDDWEEFAKVGQAVWYDRKIEDNLVLQADLVSAVAPCLAAKFSSIRNDITVIGNGYDPRLIGESCRRISAPADGTPVIGYFGHLTDSWFDWTQLLKVAESNQDLRFEIIGYGEPQWATEAAARLKNVNLIGKVPPSRLHEFVRRWSAGVIPFIEGRLSEAVDPIKLYEYLYFGLPVVATGIRHAARYPMTHVADRGDLGPAIRRALGTPWSEEAVESFLQDTTWTARFDALFATTSDATIRKLYAA
ncbi:MULTISPECIES: methyltransferase domain-containing protein [Chelativorans]|uniref:Methyltransferase type 12 n=1 Tax=Chelativorans sp. (strain BNC1) TaxID=266779 RepID=Q11C12_CHESB|nr:MULTISPECIES: methyltransferase domain-containing protein [Chelativorans]